jgi:chitinase
MLYIFYLLMVKGNIGILCLALLVALAFPATITRINYSNTQGKASSTVPIRFIYIDGLKSWYGDKAVPAALGVPGYTNSPLPYNYVALAFWLYPGSAVDAAGMWTNLATNMGTTTLGSNTKEIQASLKAKYAAAGVKLMVSAFGSTQNPTSAGYDATDCGLKLAKFVSDNQLDGVDIDWEDSPAFQKGDGSGENWLITLTKVLRANLPTGSIITHAPQAPYFSGKALYPKGGYMTVDQTVGSMIDFYNVQFYNQGVGIYDTPQGLFNVSGSWCPNSSINEMIAAGIPGTKIVLGKPPTTADANNGWMSADVLNKAILDNYAYNGWKTGIMFWQLTSDADGSFCNAVGKGLITQTEQVGKPK